MSDESTILCHRCSRVVHPGRGEFYIVRIEAFADPTPPVIDDEELGKSTEETLAEYEALLAHLSDMSEQEMLDQVHRKLTLTLCTRCYQQWIESPLD